MNPKEKKLEKLDRKEKQEEKKKKKAEEEKKQVKKEQLAEDVDALVSVLREQKFHEFVRHLRSPWRIMWTNFLAGIFRGLGVLVGMTMVVGLLVWLITQLIDFPLIGQYFEILLNWIQGILPPEVLQQFENVQETPEIR